MEMHICIARLDMIVLLTSPESLNETQQIDIQRVLRSNKILFQEVQLQQGKNTNSIRNMYIRRYPRYVQLFNRLEETLSMDSTIEQIYDYCSRQYLREIKKTGGPILKTYQNIIETNRLQQLYFLKEPIPQQQQLQYSCLDYEQDESTKYLLMASLYNKSRFDEPKIIYMSDLLRRRIAQMIKEITDRNTQIGKNIQQYYNQNRKKSYCQTPTPTRSRNNTFYKTGGKVSALRIHTEFVIERKTPARSIYQIKKIQLIDENSDSTPINKNSCKALGRPRSLIRTKFQQLIN